MSVPAKHYITPEEYLEIEGAAEYRSEYFNGEMFAMSGGSDFHSLIAANVITALNIALRGKGNRGCTVFNGDLRVRVCPTGLYTYPDATVVCGERQMLDSRRDTLLNPTLIVEVLSPSTEAYDRGDKFSHYKRLESLQEYVLVSQDRPRVERFWRRGGEPEWSYAECTDPEGAIILGSVDWDLPLAEVYAQVEFPEPPPPLRRPF